MHRRGVTLTEVLVAIFVCGLGLMALMTLFPLGAMNMAQALKDDRCGHCAANASAVLRSFWRVSLETGGKIPDPGNPGRMIDDPALIALEATLAKGPVYLDPIGYAQFNGASLAGIIPRRTLGAAGFATAVKWCSLLDDIDFNPNATPVQLGGGEISRQGRYSWAWMIRWLQKPTHPDPRARALEYAVVVYHNRPMTASASLTPVGEYAYGGASFDPANRTIVVPYGGGRPAIRKGGWLLDASMAPVPQGHFYRVESVRDTGSALILGVQNAIRGGPAPYQGTVVFMDNVAEVFERSTLE
jgi:hypothetical protein